MGGGDHYLPPTNSQRHICILEPGWGSVWARGGFCPHCLAGGTLGPHPPLKFPDCRGLLSHEPSLSSVPPLPSSLLFPLAPPGGGGVSCREGETARAGIGRARRVPGPLVALSVCVRGRHRNGDEASGSPRPPHSLPTRPSPNVDPLSQADGPPQPSVSVWPPPCTALSQGLGLYSPWYPRAPRAPP